MGCWKEPDVSARLRVRCRCAWRQYEY